MITLDYDEWLEKYKPIMEDGILKDFHGSARLHVHSDANKIWTMVSGEHDTLHILSGYHRVNRMANYITELPFDQDIEIPYVTYEDSHELSQENLVSKFSNKRLKERLLELTKEWEPDTITQFSEVFDSVERLSEIEEFLISGNKETN